MLPLIYRRDVRVRYRHWYARYYRRASIYSWNTR